MATESQKYNKSEDEEISLKDLIIKIQVWWGYLLSKWMIILAFGLIGGLLGFTYAYLRKPVYLATTTFVLEDENAGSNLGNLAGLASMAGVDLSSSGGGIFQGDNILELYKSRRMISQTLLTRITINGKDQTLVNRYIEFNNLRAIWAKKEPELANVNFDAEIDIQGVSSLTPNRLRDSVMATIVSDISKNYLNVIKPDKKLSIIKVDVKAKDEIFAKEFNEAIVKNVNDFYVNTKTKKSLRNVQIMQGKTDSVRAVMNGAIYTAAAVVDATPNLNPTKQVQRIAPAQKAQFSAETNKSILGALVQNLEMSKMTLMKETPLLEVIDMPIYPLKIDRFGKFTSMIIGGMIAVFFAIIFLTLKKIFNSIIQ